MYLKFVEIQRAIVHRAGQAETVLHQHRFARTVAGMHPADLRNRGVRLIDDQQIILREKIEQRGWARTGRATGDVAGVIFDAGAETHFLHHFQIVFGAHLDALGFEQFAVFLKPRDALAQFFADGQDGRLHLICWRDELFGGINHDRVQAFRSCRRSADQSG